ncbi:hypothetical protein WDU94_000719, partial [Cyamophila willieti]
MDSNQENESGSSDIPDNNNASGDDSNSNGSADTFHVSALNESPEDGEPVVSRSMSIVNRFFSEIDQLIMEVENDTDSRAGRFANFLHSSTPQATDSAASNENPTGDDDDDDSDDEEVPFDIQLPYQHLYLSRNFQALPGHTYLEEGSIHTLSLVSSNVITGLTDSHSGSNNPVEFHT